MNQAKNKTYQKNSWVADFPVVGQWADKGDSRKGNSILVCLVCFLAYFLIRLEATLSLVKWLENLDDFITKERIVCF